MSKLFVSNFHFRTKSWGRVLPRLNRFYVSKFAHSLLRNFILFALVGFLVVCVASAATLPEEKLCGTPPLANLQSHQVKAGETLESIGKSYNLTPATLQGINPDIRNEPPKAGQVLKIPPFDGLIYTLRNEDTYRTIAEKYRLRPDVLFERNACQVKPEQVFIPGAVWRAEVIPVPTPTYDTPPLVNTGGYPLPYPVPVTSDYGWRVHPITGETAFHAGIDLGAPMGTPVLANNRGRVEYAGLAGTYGNLVEINHGSFSTRYAHLSAIGVSGGQSVKKGQVIGLVGSTGRSTGPHLHFELLLSSGQGLVSTNPAPFLGKVAQRWGGQVSQNYLNGK